MVEARRECGLAATSSPPAPTLTSAVAVAADTLTGAECEGGMIGASRRTRLLFVMLIVGTCDCTRASRTRGRRIVAADGASGSGGTCPGRAAVDERRRLGERERER